MAENEMTCRELVELITAYLERSLAPEQRERFDAHLAACEGCRAYLDQMRRTTQLLGTFPEESLAPPAKRALLAAFRAWKSGRLPDA
jgi:predicted anti-sigma-YlaC factor YlaD